MTLKLIIPGPIPSKKNSRRIGVSKSTGKQFNIPSKNHEDWAGMARKALFRHEKCSPCNGVVCIKIVFWWGCRRKCDLSNKAESIMDLLVKCGVVKDDSWDIVPELILVSGGIDKNKPRAEVFITNFI